MQEKYFVTLYTENQIGLLNRITNIFTRRQINIESLTTSQSEIEGVYKFTILVFAPQERVEKVISQLEKQIDVIKAFFHLPHQTVYQEIAMYKVSLEKADIQINSLDEVVRKSEAKIISLSKEFIIIEKTGHPSETEALLNELRPFGILQFVRSGCVAITKDRMEVRKLLS